MVLLGERLDIVLHHRYSADHFDIDRHAPAIARRARARCEVSARAPLVLLVRQAEALRGNIYSRERRVDGGREARIDDDMRFHLINLPLVGCIESVVAPVGTSNRTKVSVDKGQPTKIGSAVQNVIARLIPR